MKKSIIYLFTSPTCPNCPPAKNFIHEFKKERGDFILEEFSTATHEGQQKAREFDIRAVPTFIIKGEGYSQPIGLVGVQSVKAMNKYLNLSYGIEERNNKKSLRDRLKEGIRIGKFKIKF